MSPKDIGECAAAGIPFVADGRPLHDVQTPSAADNGSVNGYRPHNGGSEHRKAIDNKRSSAGAARDGQDGAQLELAAILGDDLPAGVAPGTDLATATLLQLHHGQDLLYSSKLGWLAWDGMRFRADDTGEVSRRIQNIGRRLGLGAAELYRLAALESDEERKSALRKRASAVDKWAAHSQNEKGLEHAMSVAETLLPTRPDDMDADPWLLNCENGTIDLRTGSLRKHDRADKITKLAPVRFDRDAPAPRFDRFLREILPADDVRGFVQKYLGYSITGSTREQCFVIALGKGANGKSVLSEAVRYVLGDYASDTPTDTIMCSKNSRGTENDIARLRGSRFVTAKEVGEGRKLDESRVKQLTGGDTVTARFLFREWFEFIPRFKLWVYANYRPQIRGTDEGIWRRIMLVPFDVVIPEEQRDGTLPETLRAEAAGILAWLVRGCIDWQRSGLQPPATVLAATQQYRAESDDVARFVDECCTRGDYAKTKSSTLFEAYQRWARDQGAVAAQLSQKAFSERLTALGFEAARTKTERYWRGIGLTTNDTEENDDDA
jgi:putative DNA primase/helicase